MNSEARFPAVVLSIVLSTILFALAGCGSAAPTAAATPTGAAAGSVASDTATASATPSATATATATATPAPSPTPTLSPEDLPAAVARLSADGDYAAVIAAVEPELDALPADADATLRLALARAYAAQGRSEEAVALLQELLDAGQPAEVEAQALAALGQVAEDTADWSLAVDSYRRYLEYDDSAAPYLHWRIAQDLVAAGDDSAALDEIAAVDLATLSTSLQAEILEEQAAAQRRQSDYDGALASYEAILAFARNNAYVALINQMAGQTLLEAGRQDEAVTRLTAVMDEYPDTYAAYLALTTLDELEASDLSGLARGRILYAAGRYADAVAALQGYVDASDNPGAAALYYLGLANEGAGQYDPALSAYDRVLADYADDPIAPAVCLAKARATADQDLDASALYADFVARYPDDARAPLALWEAAVELQRADDWPGALGFYQRLWSEYPDDDRAPEALFREGLARYASGDDSGAGAIWLYALSRTAADDSDELARLNLWLGLAAAHGGNPEAAFARWHLTYDLQPDSYYGLRARDLLAGTAPVDTTPVTTADLPDEALSDDEWAALADWVAAVWPAEEKTEISTDILDATLVQQIRALEGLGWGDEAETDWSALRDTVRDDPRGLLALAQFSAGLRRYNTTIFCGERLAALAAAAGDSASDAAASGTPAADATEAAPPEAATPNVASPTAAPTAPAALDRLIYPTYYGHLVLAEAAAWDVDPLLFLALMRQESRFEADAISYAGATGLAQVMPATGEWIASMVGEGDYSESSLTRPVVSVRYGMWYLAQMLEQTDGDWMAALVAYNAGPGNLARWTGDEPIADHDLFYETIPLTEPQSYVRLIYPYYERYQQLYRQAPEEQR